MLSKFWEGHHLRCPEAAGSLVQRGRPISEGKEEMPDPGMGTEASRTTPDSAVSLTTLSPIIPT